MRRNPPFEIVHREDQTIDARNREDGTFHVAHDEKTTPWSPWTFLFRGRSHAGIV